MSSVEIKLIEHTVSVTDNQALADELQTVVLDRLKYRKAIRECLSLAASGRIYNALEVLRTVYPQAADLSKVGAGETAVQS